MFVEVLSYSIVTKYIMDKVGITNYIYDKWCTFIDRYNKCDVFKDELYENEDQEKILTLGCRDNKTPIKVNMNIDPHMLVVGISNCGKSKMVEKCLQDKKSITILNSFETDFTSLGANYINGEHYVAIGIACINDGSAFTINSTDMELLKLKPFSKHIANFTLMDSKYGMRLSIDSIE